MKRRLLMWILWPAFLSAALAELVVFAVVDPADPALTHRRNRNVIPRIQSQIDEESDPEARKRLVEYQEHHIFMWKEMEALVDALCKNAYVKRRTHNSAEQLHHFRRGLYDQLRD